MTATVDVLPLPCSLELDGVTHDVVLVAASRLSFLVRFAAGVSIPFGTVFTKLVVHREGKPLTLTRVRLEGHEGRSDVAGRLVFVDDVFDCRALVNEGRVKNLLGFFNELPLVLAQREQITPEFSAYVADLNYDLTVYKKFFDEQDRLFEAEPASVAAAAQQVLLARTGKEFFDYLDRMLEQLGQLVRDFTPEQHERHGYYFRQQLWPFIMSSAFMARTNLKPRGYAGDAGMMEMIYDNTWNGRWVFNKLMHKHPVGHAAAQAVRNRRVLVPTLLREQLATSTQAPFKVLSVACGPARELADVFRSPADCHRIAVTLLDQDDEALSAARATVSELEGTLGASIAAKTVNDSVRTLLKEADLAGRLGRFDFIYTMGMFDYLTPPVAKAVLARLYELLAPGGVAVVGNYHVANRSRFYMAYWLDWILYYRTEGEMMAMASALPNARTTVGLDDSNCQMFLRVEKPG